MARYIDADELLETIQQHDYLLATRNGSIDNGMFTIGIKQAVDEQPTSDVAPVVHGHWIQGYDDSDIPIDFDCSVCNMPNDWESDYCPNCGARLDGNCNEK